MDNKERKRVSFINYKSIKEFIIWIITSMIMFVIIEYLSRGSFEAVKVFIEKSTKVAMMNLLLVLGVTGIMFLFKHRKAVLVFMSFILLLLGVINKMILSFRGMPIAFMDLYSINDGLSVASRFINSKIIMIAVIILVIFITTFIFMWKLDKENHRFDGISNIIVWIMTIVIFTTFLGPFKEKKVFNNIAWNIQKSYEANGFLYSLLDSYFGYLRKAPEGYSEENIKKIRAEVDKKEKEDKRTIKSMKDAPNVLVVQLEGFMDPTKVPNLKLSMDPIPNFRKLMEENASGYMNVPTTGGGTARTEFEVFTGNSFDYLLSGEIPYTSIVREKTSNSLATALKKQGFGVHAIHNFKGNFYNRNKGYNNLGFDTFTSLEYMNGMEYTKLNWTKDYILTKYIKKCLDSTKQKDLVCTVSVQGHSYYPDKIIEDGYPCKVSGKMDKKYLNQFYYYCEQIREMDKFVKQLNDMLVERKKQTGEDTIVVYYGDHMPGLDYLYDGKEYLDRYESVYAYFSTFEIPKEKNTIKDSYQVGENTLKYSGIKYGPIEKLHAYLESDKDYQKKMELVQYDILFGKKYYLKENEKQEENNMKMGIDDIKIKNIKTNDKDIELEGENFTERSFIYINDKKLETKFISPQKIIAKSEENIKQNDKIIVKQLGDHDAELSGTKEYTIK